MPDYFDPTIGKKNVVISPDKGEYFDPTLNFPQGGQAQEVVTQKQMKEKEQGLLPALKRVGHEFAGGDKEFNFPDISMADIFNPKLAAGLLAATDEKQVEDIIKSNIPDAQINKDKFGKTYVGIPGKGTFYTEGLSQNLLRAGGQGAAYTAGALTGTGAGRLLLGPAMGALPTALGAGLGTAATSGGLDVAAQIAGSEQPISRERVLTGGLAGFAGELAAPAIRALIGPIRKTGAAIPVSEAKAQLKNMGFDTTALTDDTIKTFQARALESIDPQYAAAYAEANGLPVPVKLTKGQITGSPMDQLTEDALLKGVYGEAPRNRMKAFTSGQQQALRENVPAIQGRISGGTQQVTGVREGGEIAAQALVKNAAEAKSAVNNLYDIAKGKNASIGPKQSSEMLREVLDTANQWRIGAPPELKQAVGELRRLTREGASIDKIEEWRQLVNKAISANKNNGNITGSLGDIKRTVDDYLQRASDAGVLQGDQDAIAAWNEAIKARASYGREYQARDIIERLTKKQPLTGDFTIDPRVAADEIFGTRGGFSLGSKYSKPNDLSKIKNNLVKSGNEDAWNALREEAFIRLAGKAEGSFSGGERAFSGVNFSKALNNALRTNKAEMTILFKPDEIALMKQFANVSAKVTNTARNTSNTAILQAGLIKKIMSLPFFSQKAEAVLSAVPGFLRAAKGSISSLKATGGVIPRGATSGVTGGLAATASQLALQNSVMKNYPNQ